MVSRSSLRHGKTLRLDLMARYFTRERFGRPQFLAGLLLLAFLLQAMWLIHRELSAAPLPQSEEALRIGLANRVVPADELMKEARRLAQKLAMIPPPAMQLNKQGLNRAYDLRGFQSTVDLGAEIFLTISRPIPRHIGAGCRGFPFWRAACLWELRCGMWRAGSVGILAVSWL